MDFYTEVGKLALGSRLRRLAEQLMEDAAKVYEMYEVPLDPKWFPVFYACIESAYRGWEKQSSSANLRTTVAKA